MASGVVTRSPPLNSDSMPSRSSIVEIWGPPPCTTTGRKPANRRNAMSSAKARLRVSSVIALPPYFTTTIFWWYAFSHGSAAASVRALAWSGLLVSNWPRAC